MLTNVHNQTHTHTHTSAFVNQKDRHFKFLLLKDKYFAQLFLYKVHVGIADVLIGSAIDCTLYRVIAN